MGDPRNSYLIERAIRMLKLDDTYRADAIDGAPVGNTIVGALLAFETGVPRQFAEAAVVAALQSMEEDDHA